MFCYSDAYLEQLETKYNHKDHEEHKELHLKKYLYKALLELRGLRGIDPLRLL